MTTACPVCEGRSLQRLLERRGVPVHQHLLFSTPEAARGCARGDIILEQCLRCGFVFNAAFDESLLQYSADYDNAQAHSAAFQSYMDGLVGELRARYALRGKTIVEIGCGKGEFLARLCSAESGNTGIGFDPSYVPERDPVPPGVRIIPDFYSRDYAHVAGELVCSRHVIEHIPQPRVFLETIRGALQERAETALFFETPALEWILENGVFWDIFFEHCSYFAIPVLAYLFRASGFDVTSSRAVFGGQYQWIEARPAGTRAAAARPDPAAVGRLTEQARAFSAECARKQAEWTGRIRELGKGGSCVVWGAGAKGVTFLNTLGLGPDKVPAVIDVNPRKQGRYIAGTAQPIIPPDALRNRSVAAVLVMNPNYLEEIRETIAELGVPAELVPV